MDPDIIGAHRLAYRAHRIERAGVHIAGLGADDGRTLQLGQSLHAHAALVIDGHPDHPVPPEPEHAQRLEQGGVRLLAHHDGDFRRSMEPAPVHVMAVREQHGPAVGRERGEIGHRRPGDERGPRIRRQVERFQHPPRRDPLDCRADRRAHFAEGVLVPRGREPVRGQGGRQDAAGHEAEIARARARNRSLSTDFVEPGEDSGSRQPLFRQRAAQRRRQFARPARRNHGAFGKRFQKPRRAPHRLVQQLPHAVHAAFAPDGCCSCALAGPERSGGRAAGASRFPGVSPARQGEGNSRLALRPGGSLPGAASASTRRAL